MQASSWGIGSSLKVNEGKCHVLLIEPRYVVNTGGFGGEVQAENYVRV